jgi:hypothetical protein
VEEDAGVEVDVDDEYEYACVLAAGGGGDDVALIKTAVFEWIQQRQCWLD